MLPHPELPKPESTVQCDDCGSHFQLSPSMASDGMACPECGGKRLFFGQPSPVESEGTLRNMVDSDSQKDEGGHPLGEGTIVGDDGIVPYATGSGRGRDDGTYSATSVTEEVEMRRELNMEPYMPWTHEAGVHLAGPAIPAEIALAPEEAAGAAAAAGGIADAAGGVADAASGAAGGVADAAGSAWQGVSDFFGGGGGKAMGAGGLGAAASKLAPTLLKGVLHAGEKGALRAGENALGIGSGGGAQAGSDQPEQVTPAPNMISYGGHDTPEDTCPECRGHAIDENGRCLDCGYRVSHPGNPWAGHTPSDHGPADSDPYDAEYPGTVASIPFMLVAEMETPHSFKSVDEQHDDPEQQDQKEFNDGDDSPSNLRNPNNEDSGSDGEDGVRNATPGYGFGENSPGLERMMMVLPLLLHYFDSPDSGEQDPIIKALHETLEKENPGYLDQEDPDGHGLIQTIIQQRKNPQGVHAGVAPVPGAMPAPAPAQGGGTCPTCGGQLGPDGTCPTCSGNMNPMPGPSAPAGGASMPPMIANHQGPISPEQIEAVAQLLISEGRSGEVQTMKQAPQLYQKELQQVQQNQQPPPPLVDPSQTPPPPMEGAPGAMPMPDQMGGNAGGMPMQPMASQDRLADANNRVPRCPKCDSATTSVAVGADNDLDGTLAQCHACGNMFKVPKPQAHEGRQVWAEIPNPNTLPANEQHQPVDHEHTHDPAMVWTDNSGQPLEAGQSYELHSPAFPVPDIVQVVYVHPDEIGLNLVGQVSNLDGDQSTPDIKVTRQEAQLEHYTFMPSQGTDQDMDARNTEPPTGTPGLEQVPPSGPTTDELQDSYPNTSVAHVADPSCLRCGSSMIDHTMSSPTMTMHECVKCAHVWETEEESEGREASVDVSWLLASEDWDSGRDLDRVAAMAAAESGQSRSLASIAAKDERLQRVKAVLDSEKQRREAGRHFSPGEKRALIDEHGHARNLGDLDLSHTHYDTQIDYTGKADGENAPDEHLIFGI